MPKKSVRVTCKLVIFHDFYQVNVHISYLSLCVRVVNRKRERETKGKVRGSADRREESMHGGGEGCRGY